MVTIEEVLEDKLVKACEEGNVEVCQSSVVDLQSRYGVATEAVQELLGYAFSCAAAHNQIEIMKLLLYPSDKTNGNAMTLSEEVHECLLYGMCRWEKYFPRRKRFQCCFALRYLAYAAVICVEQNALQALEFLVQHQTPPMPSLLVDTDVVRCFRYALELGGDFNAPAPQAYRPMLMLLLYNYPTLLLPHVDGTYEVDASLVGATRKHIESLRSSLHYEYVTNPQLQK
ncbi:hypothetical protein F441_01073 [Phytophthora nicotianae CJ01A1]|uniref:Uncharacterized protein n=2 Tax=Phytophthora nicotianae TaxID=4792 RepID=W2RHL5_PHYN3|nr:hypothetical protein PPTG_00935 [Phytophthora nicotianae INRA-310]ETN24716.1 hypothetical protein PPTG_00935 [Phytophthora nicotianae INRA-310]ETP26131.1 hypothetical protein F441_01073 [Phytophthora nicotianae CJ01A1]